MAEGSGDGCVCIANFTYQHCTVQCYCSYLCPWLAQMRGGLGFQVYQPKCHWTDVSWSVHKG